MLPNLTGEGIPSLTREEAAAWLSERGLPTKPKKLAYEASARRGPPYFRYGRFTWYKEPELELYLKMYRQNLFGIKCDEKPEA